MLKQLTYTLMALLLGFFEVQAQLTSANFSANQTQGCSPLNVQFSNSSTAASSFIWSFGDGSSSTLRSPSKTYLQSGSYDISLIAIHANGQSDTLTRTAYIQVGNKPQTNFTYQLLDSCLASNHVSFTNLSQGANSYLWDFGDGHTSTNPNPQHTYQNSGTYQVSLVASDSLGCSNLFTHSNAVQIYPQAQAIINQSRTYQCSPGDQIQLYSQGQHANQWEWNFGNGQTSTQAHPTVQYQTTGTYDVSLKVNNAQGCADSLTLLNHLHYGKSPTPSVQLNQSSICVSDSLIVNASPQPNTSYAWLINGQVVDTTSSLVYQFTQVGTKTITLISQQNQSCPDTLILSQSFQVLPAANASFSFDTLSLCTGGQINFQSISGASQYHWDFGDGSTSTQANPSHVYQQGGTYTVKLSVSNANQCQTDSSISITINDFQAKIEADPLQGCLPLAVQFNDSSLNSNKWMWHFGDGNTSQLQNPQHTYYQKGQHQVWAEIETNNGCKDTAFLSSPIEVKADTFNLNGDTVFGCSPTAFDLSRLNLGSTQWTWHLGNGDTLNQRHPAGTFDSAGTYTISLHTQTYSGCPLVYQNIITYQISEVDIDASLIYYDCSDKIVQVSDSTPGATSWLWDFGDGNYSNAQSPAHKYSDTNSYSITLTVTTQNGCQKSVYFPRLFDFRNCTFGGGMSADTTSTVDTSHFAIPHNSSGMGPSKCAPQIVQFAPLDSTSTQWFWDFGDGNTSTQQNPKHTYYRAGLYNITLIESGPNGVDTTFMPNEVEVLGPRAKYRENAVIACDSVHLQLTNQSINAQTWFWSLNGRDSIPDQVLNLDYPLGPSLRTASLMAFDTAGCVSQNTGVFNYPKKEVFFQQEDSACIGDTISFMALDSSMNYIWNMGNGFSDTSNHRFSYSYTRAGKYRPFVISLDSINCLDTFYLNQVTIQGVAADFVLADSAICQRQNMRVWVRDSSASKYDWYFNGSFMGEGSSASAPINASGSFQISLTVHDGSCVTQSSSPKQLTVKPMNMNFSVERLTSCAPYQFLLKDKDSNRLSRQWNIDGQNFGTSDSLIISRNDTNSFMVELIATNTNGCSDTLHRFYQATKLKAAVKVSDSIICTNQPITFETDTLSVDSVLWDFGDGHQSNSMNAVHQYSQSGLYSIKLIKYGKGGCIDSAQVNDLITVNGVNAHITSNYSSSCAPMMVQFRSNATQAISWKWSFGDGDTSTLENPVHTYHNSGYFDVSLITTSTMGCIDTIVHPNYLQVPGPITKFSVSDTQICQSNYPIQFTDSSSNAVSWNWDFGDGHQSNQQHPTHTYQSAGTYQPLLITTDAGDCQGYYQLGTPIKVGNNPQADFEIQESDACTPFVPLVQNKSVGASQYQWWLDSIMIGQAPTPNDTIYQGGNFDIKLVAMDHFGCSDTASRNIQINESPNPRIVSPPDLCFSQDSIQLQSVDRGGCWHGNGILNSQTGWYKPVQNVWHMDTILHHFDGTCKTSDTVLLEVKPTAVAEIKSSQSEGCYQLNTSLEAEILLANLDTSRLSYSWFANGNLIGQDRRMSYLFSPGNYDIELMIDQPNGCSESILKESMIVVHDSVAKPVPIQSVDVMGANQIMVNWGVIQDPSFKSMKIFRKKSSETDYQEIASITNASAQFYLDAQVEPSSYSYCYKLVVENKCDQSQNLNQVQEHCSIKLQAQKKSKQSILLQWTDYKGANVKQYLISRYASESKKLETIDTVDWRRLTYVDTTAYCAEDYSYQITALLSDSLAISARSNADNQAMLGQFEGLAVQLERSTVVDNQDILIEWTEPASIPAKLNGYRIYKAKAGENFQELTQVPLGQTYYRDQEVDVSQYEYAYKVGPASSCPVDIKPENYTSPILLKGNQFNDSQGQLRWTEYKNSDQKVLYYMIQKQDEYGRWIDVKMVPANQRVSEVEF